MNGSSPAPHRFQSFWHGRALSPYELFCLKSFIDCGYLVDLYTYDADLVVPAGVQVCDAAELLSPDEVFVYQGEGLGKGSPSGFSNLFRYKLLVEKGGWWIDTDVVCLTDRIPVVDEFFARQDNDIVACGTMYFEPRHPVMVQCLEQARKLGRAVKWGDTGPHLLTRVLEERGCVDRALPPSVCYPTHHSQALDALRPSKTVALSPQLDSSLFLHVWTSMLVYLGVQMAFLPPKGSLLRNWAYKHPVDGWIGEYDEQTLDYSATLKAELNASVQERTRLQIMLEQQVAEIGRLKAECGAIAEEKARLLQTVHELKVAESKWLRDSEQADEKIRLQVAENQRLEAHSAKLAAQSAWHRAELDSILASTSWRLTAPMRALRRPLSTLRQIAGRR